MNALQFAVAALGAAACALFFAVWRLWNRQSRSEAASVVNAVQAFAEQMEKENDRLIEMIAVLRRKIDEDAMSSSIALVSLQDRISELEGRLQATGAGKGAQAEADGAVVARFERPKPAVRPEPAARAPAPAAAQAEGDAAEGPAFLSVKYREVARRLKLGEAPRAVARELGLRRGEIELVARIVDSGRAGGS